MKKRNANQIFFHCLLFISVVTEPFFPCSALQNDVNVSGNQLGNLLTLDGLNRIVLVLECYIS